MRVHGFVNQQIHAEKVDALSYTSILITEISPVVVIVTVTPVVLLSSKLCHQVAPDYFDPPDPLGPPGPFGPPDPLGPPGPLGPPDFDEESHQLSASLGAIFTKRK